MSKATRSYTGATVFDEALDRIVSEMSAGHRLVVGFSSGKDSGVLLELTLLAAKLTGYGVLDVVIRDEEAMLPGSYEYAERVAQRPDVRMTWLVAHQPILNIYNRANPYWWVFDPMLPPDKWLRQPPDWATEVTEYSMDANVQPNRFPVQDGQQLRAVIGLRVQESRGRLYGLFSSGGYLTKPNRYGVCTMRPLYDWTDGDIWRAISENKWDYNHAYDALHRLGLRRSRMRMAPPTMNMQGAPTLKLAARAWPAWFERLSQRCPGVRAGAMFGVRAIQPQRRQGESWEQCFYRECVTTAPEWIAKRASKGISDLLRTHERHSTQTLPEVEPCYHCEGAIGSWKEASLALYNGDPFASRFTGLPYVEPEFFRPGAGNWKGKPSWS